MRITTIRAAGAALVWCSLVLVGISAPVHAGTVYSYIDDQGTPVATDAPDTIPEKYRSRVKTHEQPDPKPPSFTESLRREVSRQAERIGLPSISLNVAGWKPAQSRILTYAGAAAIVLLGMMYLSKSQLVRLLGLGLLIVLGIGAPVLMYISDGGPMDTMTRKATAAGQAQQDRLEHIPR